jgi:hypothetical protein
MIIADLAVLSTFSNRPAPHAAPVPTENSAAPADSKERRIAMLQPKRVKVEKGSRPYYEGLWPKAERKFSTENMDFRLSMVLMSPTVRSNPPVSSLARYTRKGGKVYIRIFPYLRQD